MVSELLLTNTAGAGRFQKLLFWMTMFSERSSNTSNAPEGLGPFHGSKITPAPREDVPILITLDNALWRKGRSVASLPLQVHILISGRQREALDDV